MADIFEEFENTLNDVEKKKRDLASAEERLKILALRTVAAGGEATQPVDVDDVLIKLGSGLSAREIEVAPPKLTEGKIRSYEGEWNKEIEEKAARIRKTIAIAAQVALIAAKTAL
jgi:hypothetical protein